MFFPVVRISRPFPYLHVSRPLLRAEPSLREELDVLAGVLAGNPSGVEYPALTSYFASAVGRGSPRLDRTKASVLRVSASTHPALALSPAHSQVRHLCLVADGGD